MARARERDGTRWPKACARAARVTAFEFQRSMIDAIGARRATSALIPLSERDANSTMSLVEKDGVISLARGGFSTGRFSFYALPIEGAVYISVAILKVYAIVIGEFNNKSISMALKWNLPTVMSLVNTNRFVGQATSVPLQFSFIANQLFCNMLPFVF